MLSFIIALVAFIYLVYRINNLERKLASLDVSRISSDQTQTPKDEAVDFSPINLKKTEDLINPAPWLNGSAAPEIPLDARQTKSQGESKDTEFVVGSKVLTAVGLLAVLLGVGFFLRYAFSNDLISESMRVILGGLAGIVSAGIGHFLSKKYPSYGHSLLGAGLGITYLSAYAAYSFYSLIGSFPAFILFAIITAVGSGLAVIYNSKPLMVYSLVGGFIIPLILPLSASPHVLFSFLIVLNAGILVVARFKIWPELAVMSIVGTGSLYIQWLFGPYHIGLFVVTLAYCTVIFGIYFTTSLLNFIFRDRDYKGIDGFLLYSVPIIYFLLNIDLMNDNEGIALFALAIGIFYILISTVIRAGFRDLGELRTFSNAMLMIAMPFIAGATALHFDGFTLTIVWAVEAVAMLLVGYLLNTSGNRILGIILSLITGLHFFASDLDLNMSDLIFNKRSAVILFVLAMYAVFWKIYSVIPREFPDTTEDERTAGRNIGSVGAFIVFFAWITVEAIDFLVDYDLYLPLIWIIGSGFAFGVAFAAKEKTIRYLSYFTLFIAGFWSLIAHFSIDLSRFPSFFNIRTLTSVVFAAAVMYVFWLYKLRRDEMTDEEGGVVSFLIGSANILFLWAVTREIVQFYNARLLFAESREWLSIENTKRVTLSIFWLIYAFIGLGVGIFKRSSFVRYFSIILFAITIFKIFLYDTANLNDISRFVSFISLGVILLISGFAYYKFKDRISQFVKQDGEKT